MVPIIPESNVHGSFHSSFNTNHALTSQIGNITKVKENKGY